MSALTHPRPPIVDTAVSPAAIVRGFHPGWFAAVMGTGIVGVAAYLNPGGQPGLRHTAHTSSSRLGLGRSECGVPEGLAASPAASSSRPRSLACRPFARPRRLPGGEFIEARPL